MKTLFLFFVATVILAISVNAQLNYELRGAWIATVDNIDWPSKGNTNSDSQRVEFIRLLDMHQRNGMNAMIVQIRPAADAFYPSALEPWSEWLTGKQGVAPYPYYDPLEFMINETHRRGMEFHAWCNPYRAVFNIKQSTIAANHITRTHPEWFLTYGETRYFDPGNKDVQLYVTKVIRDIVHRYDIDAVHLDDYFYPYRIAGKEFPDELSYRKYGKGMNKEDWRRSNVDSIIVMLGKMIKEEKRYCRFGISPFGIWRNVDKDPEGSNTRAGQTNFDDLYADIVLWLKNGWIDYVAPQIYFDFNHKTAPYGVLLDWWSRHSYGRHCYVGLGIFKAGASAAWRDKTLIPRELQALRSYPQIQGAIYFSSKSFEKNPNGWNDSLQQNYYRLPAVVPPMKWIDSIPPQKPDSVAVAFSGANEYGAVYALTAYMGAKVSRIRSMILYISSDSAAVIARSANSLRQIVPKQDDGFEIAVEGNAPFFPNADGKKYFIGVSLLSTTNNESALSELIVASKNQSGNWDFSKMAR